jgi:PilZ domain-containing protein
MHRLTPSQPVVLDLEEEAVDCVVDAVAGDEVTIAPVVAADAAYIPSLGRAAALVFAAPDGGERARIEGAVHRATSADKLRFVAGGGTGLPARRQTARAGVELTVEVTAPDGSEPQRLLTSDVSLGGLGVRFDTFAPPEGATLEVAIELPAAEPVRATAQVLRVAHGVAGLVFADIAATDRGRLAAFLIASRANHRL